MVVLVYAIIKYLEFVKVIFESAKGKQSLKENIKEFVKILCKAL